MSHVQKDDKFDLFNLFHNVLYQQKDLFFIADYFPSLEELILTYPSVSYNTDFVLADGDQLLHPKLRKINLSRNCIDRQSINYLCWSPPSRDHHDLLAFNEKSKLRC